MVSVQGCIPYPFPIDFQPVNQQPSIEFGPDNPEGFVVLRENDDFVTAFVSVTDDNLRRIDFQWRLNGPNSSEILNSAQLIAGPNYQNIASQITLSRSELDRYNGGLLRCQVVDVPAGSSAPDYTINVEWGVIIEGDNR